MRIKLIFQPIEGNLRLPVNYNHIIQSLIYRHLDRKLATKLHNEGYRYGKRVYKFFTFSRLRANTIEYDRERKKLSFIGNIWFYLGSLNSELLESFTLTMVRDEILEINGQPVRISAVEVEMPVRYHTPMTIKMMSPMTVYSTVEENGKKKTLFYEPWDEQFSTLIMQNLVRKFKAISDDGSAPPSIDGAYIKPVSVKRTDMIITRFKGFLIKAWKGIYELHLPPPYFEIAYNAGLGSKNSQGFGMFRVISKPNG